jgi:hypothetical protein
MAPRRRRQHRRARIAPAVAPEQVVCSEQVLLPVFLALAEHASPETVAMACCTCKFFREVGSSDVLWRKLWKKVLGTEPWATELSVTHRDIRDGVIKGLFKIRLLQKRKVEEEINRQTKSLWDRLRAIEASSRWY